MKVVFVVGPTASGKSAWALKNSQGHRAAIVNADSVQLYQGLVIGSAAPSHEDLQVCPHRLYQVVPAPERWSAGDYAREALRCLSELAFDCEVAFVVGGTGFYLKALIEGMPPLQKADLVLQAEIESVLQQNGGEDLLYDELLNRDPELSIRIKKPDHYRLVRALEIMRRTGRALTELESEFQKQKTPFPFPYLKLGLQVEKTVLDERIQQRSREMLERGLLAEVRGLLDQGLQDWEPMKSVGYREAVQHLANSGESYEELLEKIVISTRQLAKKQRTWFSRDPEILWGAAPDLEQSLQAFLMSGDARLGSLAQD